MATEGATENGTKGDCNVNIDLDVPMEQLLLCNRHEALRKIKVTKRIGKGAFASVYKAEYEGKTVALKVLAPRTGCPPPAIIEQMFIRECAALRAVDHCNVLKCFGLVEIGTEMCLGVKYDTYGMLLEYCESGTLRDLLGKQMVDSRDQYSVYEALQWLSQIAAALKLFHTNGKPIIHRDIKLENILLQKAPPGSSCRFIAKLADLGLGVCVDTDRSVLIRRRTTLSPGSGLEEVPPTPFSPFMAITKELQSQAAKPASKKKESLRSYLASKLSHRPGSKGRTAVRAADAANAVATSGSPRSSARGSGDAAVPSDALDLDPSAINLIIPAGAAPGANTASDAHVPILAQGPFIKPRVTDDGGPASAPDLTTLQQQQQHEQHKAGPGHAEEDAAAAQNGSAMQASHSMPRAGGSAVPALPSIQERSLSADDTAMMAAGGPSSASEAFRAGGAAAPPVRRGSLARTALHTMPEEGPISPSEGVPGAKDVAAAAAGAAAAADADGGKDQGGGGARTLKEQTTFGARSGGSGLLSVFGTFREALSGNTSRNSTRGRGAMDNSAAGAQAALAAEAAAAAQAAGASPEGRYAADAAHARVSAPSSEPVQEGAVPHEPTVAAAAAATAPQPAVQGDGTEGPASAAAGHPTAQQATTVGATDGGAAAAAGPTSIGSLVRQVSDLADAGPNSAGSVGSALARHSPGGGAVGPALRFSAGGKGIGPSPLGGALPSIGSTRFAPSGPSSHGQGQGQGSGAFTATSSRRFGRSDTVASARTLNTMASIRSVTSVCSDVPAPRTASALVRPALRALVPQESFRRAMRRVDSLLKTLNRSALPKFSKQSSFQWVFGLTGQAGSCMYMAPEVHRREPYNEKIDVFSFGIVIYELLGRVVLLSKYIGTNAGTAIGVYDAVDYAEQTACGFRPPQLARIPESTWDIVTRCWDADPVRRPDMAELAAELEAAAQEWEWQTASKGAAGHGIVSGSGAGTDAQRAEGGCGCVIC